LYQTPSASFFIAQPFTTILTFTTIAATVSSFVELQV
jgi:hypothetical protein